ncbi:MAG: hypothetical protein HQM07_09375 [Zetaproteobacteria bacterium]|nr:hypothetical protein [Zetaproteobacteria bacterium]
MFEIGIPLIDEVDKFGRSVIYFAAREAVVEMVQLLRSHGVRITDSISLCRFVS